MDAQFDPHTIDRFASEPNTLFPRYNANWLDLSCEAVDSLHLADTYLREENNWCNPHGHCYPTSPKSYSRAAQQPQWSPPVGKEKRGTMHLQGWRARRRSCRPARMCSVPGRGTDEAQSASLTVPSFSSGFASGLVVSPKGRSHCYHGHVQQMTNETNNPGLPHPSSKSTIQDRGGRLQQPMGLL
jgi:hypothetical protein